MKLFPKTRSDFGHRMPTYHVGERFFSRANKKHYLSVHTCLSVRIAVLNPDIPSGVGCMTFQGRDSFLFTIFAVLFAMRFLPRTPSWNASTVPTSKVGH
ncbi:MAG: hypothetical protein NW703_11695 [Nitrospiraceae bacterium]